ncbi:FkbM family methyltransferase [Helicobacter pullorum]
MLNNISNKIDSLADSLHADNILKSDIQAYKQEMRDLYLKQNQEMQTFIQNQKQEIMRHVNNRSSAIRLDMVESQQSKEGIYHFQYLLGRAHIAGKYYEIFYEFYLQNQNGKKVVFVDCGAHAGVFSDVALACGGICYAFEPNKYLYAFLRDLYKGNEKLILSNQAVSNKNGKTTFYTYASNAVSDGAGIMRNNLGVGYEVEMLDFCEFLKDIIQKHHKISLIKIDIEGAEFDVLDSLIEQKLYENVEYIMVETHERFFENPKEKIENLKNKIAKNNIQKYFFGLDLVGLDCT